MEQREKLKRPQYFPTDKFGVAEAIAVVAAVVCLVVISRVSYLFFHTFAEIFTVVIACGIFVLAWNTRKFMDNGCLTFLGIAYFFTAFFNLLHLLAYKGMPIFPGYTANLPTQLWIIQRYLISLGFLISPFLLGRRVRAEAVFAIFATAAALLVAAVFYWRIFPVCFIEGTGLTPFKTVSEYVIASIFVAAGIAFYAKRKEFDFSVLMLLLAAIVLSIFSELAFTLYNDPYALSNLVGHSFNIFAYYLVYKAIIGTAILRPYDLLFRNLKNSETALRQREEQLRLFVEHAPASIAMFDTQMCYMAVSHRWRADYGFAEQNIIGRSHYDLFPEIPLRWRQIHQRCLAGAVEQAEEDPFERPDGTVQWIRWEIRPWQTASGDIGGIILFSEDVTDRKRAEEAQRKRAEEALRMSEEEFRSLAEAMPQIVWATRADGWNIYFNQQWTEYTGMTMEESYGHGWNTPFHPDDRQRAWDAWQRATQYNERYSLECRLRRADGVYRWWLIRGEPMRGANGEILKWFGTCTDIEDIKEANALLEHRVAERTAELRQSERRYRLFIEVTSQWAWVTDANGLVVEDIPSLRSFTGQTYEEASGEGWVSALHPDDVQRTLEVWQRAVSTRTPYETEYRMRRYDGVYRLLLARGVPIIDDDVVEWVGTCVDITERKRAEEELAETKILLETLLTQAPVGFTYIDRELRYVLINEQLAVLNGLPVAAHLGKHVGDIVPALLPSVQEVIDRILATGQPVKNHEFSGETAAQPGVTRYWNESWYPIRDGAGAIVGFGAVIEEITERKQAEEKLRESREDMNQAQAVAHIGSWRLDVRRNELTWSEENHRIFGIPKGTPMTYETFLSTIHPDDREYVDTQWKAGLAGEDYDIEHRIVVDGKIKWVREKAYLEFDKNNELLGGFGITQDITERKQAEESLKQSEEKYRELVQNANSVIIRWKCDGTLVFFNEYAQSLFGYSADEVIGRDVRILLPEKESTGSNLTGLIQDIVAHPANYVNNVNENICRDGRRIWLAWTNKPILDEHGRVAEILAVGVDITERKRAEEKLRESERRERARAMELERVSNELAHKNDELESIIRIASHDLRSPLMNIKGFSSELAKDIDSVYAMLKDLPLGEKISEKAHRVFTKYVPEALGFIQGSADSINQMIKSLMSVAKAGTVPVSIRDIDMNALLAKLAANVQFKLKESGGTLTAKPLPGCRGDEDQITQIFTNLVENSIKYCHPERPCTISVYASVEGDTARYCVEDNGKGIAPEHYETVFNLFARLDPEAAAGEGIGLTIVKRMVERQGGKIWVESEVGTGSKFFVSLPR